MFQKSRGNSGGTFRVEGLQQTSLPRMSEAEEKLVRAITQEVNQRMGQIRELNKLTDPIQGVAEVGISQIAESFALGGATLSQQGTLELEEAVRARSAGFATQELTDLEAASIMREGEPSQGQLKRIEDARSALQEGLTSDLNAARDDSLLALSQFTGKQGFRNRDSPILDRAQLIARDTQRAKEDVSTEGRRFAADARLDIASREGAVQSSRVAALTDRSQALAEFQQNLKNAAIANRQSLAGLVGSFRLGSVNAMVNPAEGLQVIQQRALSSPSTNFSREGDQFGRFKNQGWNIGIGSVGGTSGSSSLTAGF